MGNESLSEKLEKAKSRSPLSGEERERAVKTLDELHIKMQVNDIRINILKKSLDEEDIYFERTISKEDYEKISKEWEEIYEILSKDCLKRIRDLIETERISHPDNYLFLVEEKMTKRESKIREFFTFNRYLSRRKDNSDKDYIGFIKEMALKNEAYEFLEGLKNEI